MDGTTRIFLGHERACRIETKLMTGPGILQPAGQRLTGTSQVNHPGRSGTETTTASSAAAVARKIPQSVAPCGDRRR